MLHPDACHFERPAASYWQDTAPPLTVAAPPLTTDTRCDVAVVGLGYTGLAAALALTAEHQLDVCAVDAAAPGWGASGRNGGFCSVGSHKLGYGAMIARYGLAATRQFYAHMCEAIEGVRDLCAAHDIAAQIHGQGEVVLAHRPQAVAALAAERDFMAATFGEQFECLSRDALCEAGMAGPHFHGGLASARGFGLHPLAYARGLATAAVRAGARLHADSAVTSWHEQGGEHELTLATGARLCARRLVIATNAYTPETVFTSHAGRLLPAPSNVLVTRPLTADELAAQGWRSARMAYDTRHLLHYFRLLPDGRFLFGGRGGSDGAAGSEHAARVALRADFEALFPAWRTVEASHFWRGMVCLARDRVPYLGPLDERASVWTALAYHGNGVAMASWCGRALAARIADRLAADALSPVLTRRLAPFPLPSLRGLALMAAYRWYGWRDGPGPAPG
jgi:glycine/D-amino acid oxidase-like deaminating enzyme